MQFRLGVTMVTALVLCLAAVADAQQEGRRGGGGFGRGGFGFGGGVSRMQLLGISQVREELNLTEEQVAAIEKFREEQRAAFGGGRGRRGGGEGQPRGRRGGNREGNRDNQTRAGAVDLYFVQQDQPEGRRGRGFQFSEEQLEQFRQAAEERAKQEREKLAEILLPAQLKRLNQIFVQVAGVNALDDSEVAKELGINDEQREKIRTVRQENARTMGEQMRELFQSGDREQVQAKMAELRKQNDEKVLAVLTDEQKKKFEEMKGEKFDLPEGALRGGGFGGGRGGARRGGQRDNN